MFDYLETGDSIDDLLEDFPSVKCEQIIKLLGFSEQITIKSTEILNANFEGKVYLIEKEILSSDLEN